MSPCSANLLLVRGQTSCSDGDQRIYCLGTITDEHLTARFQITGNMQVASVDCSLHNPQQRREELRSWNRRMGLQDPPVGWLDHVCFLVFLVLRFFWCRLVC